MTLVRLFVCAIGAFVGAEDEERVFTKRMARHVAAKLDETHTFIKQPYGPAYFPQGEWPSTIPTLNKFPDLRELYLMEKRHIPVVVKNASHAFGKRVPKWKDPQYLSKKFGNSRHHVSVFPQRKNGYATGNYAKR